MFAPAPQTNVNPNYLVIIFTHLKFRFVDAMHKFKWVKIIQIDKMMFKYF